MDSSSKPPIIFPKNHKKIIPGKATSSASSKGNVRVIVAPPAVGYLLTCLIYAIRLFQ